MARKEAADAAIDFTKVSHLRVLFYHSGKTAVSSPLPVKFMIIGARTRGDECKLALLENIDLCASRFVRILKEVVPATFHGQDLLVKGTSASSSIDDLLDTLQNAVLSHYGDGQTSAYGWRASADHTNTLCITILAEKEQGNDESPGAKSRGPKSLTAPSTEVSSQIRSCRRATSTFVQPSLAQIFLKPGVPYKALVTGALVPFTFSSSHVTDKFQKFYKNRPLVPSPAELQGLSARDKANRKEEYMTKNKAANDSDEVEIATFIAMNSVRNDTWKKHGLPLAPCFMGTSGVSPAILKKFCASFDERFGKSTSDMNRVPVQYMICDFLTYNNNMPAPIAQLHEIVSAYQLGKPLDTNTLKQLPARVGKALDELQKEADPALLGLMRAWLQHLRTLQDEFAAQAVDLDSLLVKSQEPHAKRVMPIVKGKLPDALPTSMNHLFGKQIPDMVEVAKQYIKIVKAHTFPEREDAMSKLHGRFKQLEVPEQVKAWMQQAIDSMLKESELYTQPSLGTTVVGSCNPSDMDSAAAQLQPGCASQAALSPANVDAENVDPSPRRVVPPAAAVLALSAQIADTVDAVFVPAMQDYKGQQPAPASRPYDTGEDLPRIDLAVLKELHGDVEADNRYRKDMRLKRKKDADEQAPKPAAKTPKVNETRQKRTVNSKKKPASSKSATPLVVGQPPAEPPAENKSARSNRTIKPVNRTAM